MPTLLDHSHLFTSPFCGRGRRVASGEGVLKWERWNHITTKILRQFRYLTSDIFACFLQADYPQNMYLYEKRIHTDKKYLLRHLQKCDPQLVLPFKILFDITMNMAHLRQRVTDYADLTFCKREMYSLSQEIDKFYQQLIYPKKKVITNTLEIKIQELENIYHQVLVVTTKEPVCFLLFIGAIKDLCQHLTMLLKSREAQNGFSI